MGSVGLLRLIGVAGCRGDVGPIYVVLAAGQSFEECTLGASHREELAVGQSQPLLEAPLELAGAAPLAAQCRTPGQILTPVVDAFSTVH